VAPMRGDGMEPAVGTEGLRQTDTADGHLDGVVDDARVNVMATGPTDTRGDGEIPGGVCRTSITAPIAD
jgi:hypothetical protein